MPAQGLAEFGPLVVSIGASRLVASRERRLQDDLAKILRHLEGSGIATALVSPLDDLVAKYKANRLVLVRQFLYEESDRTIDLALGPSRNRNADFSPQEPGTNPRAWRFR